MSLSMLRRSASAPAPTAELTPLQKREQLVKELDAQTLPPDTVGVKLEQEIQALEERLKAARQKWHQNNSERMGACLVLPERRNAIRRELICSANPAIGIALADVTKRINQASNMHDHQRNERLTNLQRALDQLHTLQLAALSDAQIEKQIAKIVSTL